jgi:hypothetical protein
MRIHLGDVNSLRAFDQLLGELDYALAELIAAGESAAQARSEELRERLGEAEASVDSDDEDADYSEVDDAQRSVSQFQEEEALFNSAGQSWNSIGVELLFRSRQRVRELVGDAENYASIAPPGSSDEPSSPAAVIASPNSLKPKIFGFFASGVIDDAGVAARLSVLPAHHRNGEHLTRIQYRNYYNEGDDGVTLGTTTRAAPHRIEIFRHSRHGQQPRLEFVQTLYHEVAHNVHLSCMSGDNWDRWGVVSGDRRRRDCVTDYATQSTEEDFAESYSFYVTDPVALRAVSPQRYEFLRDVVFEGREYAETTD